MEFSVWWFCLSGGEGKGLGRRGWDASFVQKDI